MHNKPFFETLERRALLAASAGLQGVYFDNSNFTGKTASRVDLQVNFNWSGAPISGIGADTFSVRWTGKVTPQTSEKYTFYVNSNNGARLWVNHKLLIDNWTSHNTIENSGSITLKTKTSYDIQLEFWDNTGGATAQLKWKTGTIAKGTIPSARLSPGTQNVKSMLDHDLAFASAQLKRTMSDLGNNHSKFVNRTTSTGTWNVVNADDWTSGFLGGQMWQLFNATGDSSWKTNATSWTTPLAGEATKQTGDLAFQLMTTFKPLYDATGNAAYKQVLLNAAASKETTWNETIGAFTTTWRKSNSGNPAANFGVLMDQTTDMQLMLWAAQNGGNPNYYNQALRHVRNVIANMVRPDGSTYQWGYFNTATGNFVDGETYQGYANESTWSRGQAWAIYAFSDIAKTTGQADILAGAQKVADWFIAHLPSDSIPYWDFNDPKIPNTFRDTSAAAVAADGLIQLSTLVTDPTASAKYRSAAEKILTSLSNSKYLAESSSSSRGILLHGAQNVPNDAKSDDVSLSFGDYYFLDAINRYRALA
jgi:unsaturated chondroitin disaccharide hydrolase